MDLPSPLSYQWLSVVCSTRDLLCDLLSVLCVLRRQIRGSGEGALHIRQTSGHGAGGADPR